MVLKQCGHFVLVLCLLTACSSTPDPQIVDRQDADGVVSPLDDVGTADANEQVVDASPDVALDSTPDAAMPDASPDASADVNVAPTTLVIHLDPGGDDANDGATETAAVKTLERAHQLAGASGLDRDVEVRIAPGTYYGQTVSWTNTDPDRQISFTRWPRDAEARPIFDGCTSAGGACPGGTWFRLQHSGGEKTNLEFYYIQVQNYGTAISLDGGRNAESQSNGSNRIFGCYFLDIGNEFNPSLGPSTAAVRLVNSDDNVIENNHFVNVVNTTSGGLIHAIYVAHMSDRNTIARNRFKRSTGDPVRVRDYSNDNVIDDNRFIQVGTAAGYTDWYCDHEVRNDCTKVDPECPSWGNLFRNNLLDGKYDCTPLGVFHYFQDETTTGCAPPAADSRRLRTSGNTQHTPPCTSG